tara:strand:+ start:1853 stop:2389 length:537 start_codon:yes stop_codon:yes gene_type:complete
MTFIKLSDIREIDVAPEAGMSNVPWEYDYGFQIIEDVSESQEDILSSKYNYKSESNEDGVLDGLCPDADDSFTVCIPVKRKSGKEVIALYSREKLILEANKLLKESAIEIEIAIQRECIHGPPTYDIEITYEICSAIGKKKVILIDDIYHPLSQILDLRGLPSIGYIEWVEDDDVCEI